MSKLGDIRDVVSEYRETDDDLPHNMEADAALTKIHEILNAPPTEPLTEEQHSTNINALGKAILCREPGEEDETTVVRAEKFRKFLSSAG